MATAGLVAGCSGSEELPVVTFSVDFDGNPSCFAADVQEVRVTFLDVNSVPKIVPCDSEEGVSIGFPDLEEGTYRVGVDGLKNKSPTWIERQEILVTKAGTRKYHFSLKPLAPEVVANFKFAAPNDSGAGMTCAQAEVKKVQVTIDKTRKLEVPCYDPQSDRDAALISNVAEGTHDFTFAVLDGQGQTLYEMSTKQPVKLTSSNSFNINLKPKTTGNLQLLWTFNDAQNCAGAGVDKIAYELKKPDGSAGPSGTVDCADMNGANSAVQHNTLTAGMYPLVKMQGLSGSTPVYSAAATSVFVLPGQTKAYSISLTPSN
jgi:hypothetical protein